MIPNKPVLGKKAFAFMLILLFSTVSMPISIALSGQNLTYDSNGNLIGGFDKTYEYNGFNQLKSVRNEQGELISSYFYDHEGKRIKKVSYESDGSNTTTYYVGKNFVQIVNSSGTYNETYYYDEFDLVAKKDSIGIYYYHPDYLGSTTLITNSSGEIEEKTDYLPYGEIISGGNSRYLFTGKEKDVDTGLHYYGARYYDSYFRRFVQPDTNIKEIYNPQDLNRYAYTRNNPYKYTDPSGNIPTLAVGAIGAGIGAAIGATASITSQLINTGQVNWADVGKSTAAGGVSLGVIGLSLGVAPAILGSVSLANPLAATTLSGVGGAVAAGAGQLTTNILDKRSLGTGIAETSVAGLALGIGFPTIDSQALALGALIGDFSQNNNLADINSQTNEFGKIVGNAYAIPGGLNFPGYKSYKRNAKAYQLNSAKTTKLKDASKKSLKDSSSKENNNQNSDSQESFTSFGFSSAATGGSGGG